MRKTAILSFNAELNDFLSKRDKFQRIEHQFDNTPVVKDSIEALGIPHPEIAVIKANNITVGFDYKVKDGDEIVVSPYLYHSNIQPIIPIKPEGKPKFILDVHLGGLARYLRMAGFDTLYNNEDWGDKYIADTGGKENRIVLSRDIGLLKRSSVIYGYYVRKKDSMKQFIEIAERYSLRPYFTPFTICIKCNGKIASVDKNEIVHLLEEGTKNEHNEFWQCTSCQQIYWQGTHYVKMEKLIQNIKLSGNNDPK